MRIDPINLWRVWIPAGTYLLGDPCYAVPDDLWDEAGKSCDWWESSPIATVVVNNKEYKVLGFGTTYGDGSYTDNDGLVYPVDAGLIGLVPIELANPQDPYYPLNSVVVFDRETLCTNDNGIMKFGNIHIDIKNLEEEEEY